MPHATIAIIGAGFSGTVLAIRLQEVLPRGSRIRLIERSGRFGPGLAYGTSDPNHLLNVPAGRMSAFPERPLDFLHWLLQQPAVRLGHIAPAENAFVPRSLYAGYLQHLLQRAVWSAAGASLELIDGHVARVQESDAGAMVSLSSGASLSADIVVLATGNAPPAPFPVDTSLLGKAGIWRGDPWAPDAFTGVDPGAPMLIIGSGLTAVDAVITLLGLGHAGPIHMVSRHGLLPRRHSAQHAAPAPLPLPLPDQLTALTRHLRVAIASAIASGNDWRPVIDSLRPHTQELWHNMTLPDRRRFRRHLCALWDAHRHRMAPRIADRVEQAKDSEQLHVHAGRIMSFDLADECARVEVCLRRDRTSRAIQAVRVVNCTGPCTDVTHSLDPLRTALLQSGIARPDALRLGLDVAPNGALIGRGSAPSSRFFALGPLTKGSTWEITAVPEIRRQCQQLAEVIADTVQWPPARRAAPARYGGGPGQAQERAGFERIAT